MPGLEEMLLSLSSCDILLHALCWLSNYNTHVNEAARDNPFCGMLHIRACLVARLCRENHMAVDHRDPPSKIMSQRSVLLQEQGWEMFCHTQDWASLRAASWGIHLPPSQPHHLDALPHFPLPSGCTLKPADGQELCESLCLSAP